MNQCAKSFAKLFSNLLNDIMSYEEPFTPLLLQVLFSLSTNSIKDSNQNIGGKIVDLPDLKKRTVVTAIMRKWSKRIWVIGSDACIL